MYKLFLFLLGSMALSCNDSGFSTGGGSARQSAPVLPAASGKTKTEQFQLRGEIIESGKVDIVFVVDTSGSMSEEKDLLEKNMASFIQEFQQKNASVDYLVHMVGEDFQFPTNNPKVQLVNQPVFSNDGLAILYNFLAFGYNGIQVRPGSTIEVVMITDDNARASTDPLPIQVLPYPYPQSPDSPEQLNNVGEKAITLDANQFVQRVSKLGLSKLHINGLVGKTEGVNNDWCRIEEVGTEYEALASMPQYNGLMEDLCTEDWSPLLTRLAASIIKRVEQGALSLSSAPDLSRNIQVLFNNQPIDRQMVLISPAGQVKVVDPQLKRQSGTLTVIYTATTTDR